MDRSILKETPTVYWAMAVPLHWCQPGLHLYTVGIPHRRRRLEIAIEQARQLGLLGGSILVSFAFDISLRLGAGALFAEKKPPSSTRPWGNGRTTAEAALPRPRRTLGKTDFN